MLFHSFEYIFLFLPVTFATYFFLAGRRLPRTATGFLALASLVFYGWWNWIYLPLIAASIVFNFAVGRFLNNPHPPAARKAAVAAGVAADLCVLGFFKYTDFLIGNVNAVLHTRFPMLHILLPLGISFFTFQKIAYLVDCYRNKAKEYSFTNYALFVLYFPQLIAGPIVHHSEVMPQFADPENKAINTRNVACGLFVFAIGLFKKVVLADTFAVWATNGFDNAATLNFIEAWCASFSYTFQLYFDFSGYSDMAIGAALLFNIRLPANFNSPYQALTIEDFWKRWHITLGRFMRDYVYASIKTLLRTVLPASGLRMRSAQTHFNLLATFLLVGLWHGAGWTFVVWGLLHGAAMSVHRAWRNMGLGMSRWLAWLITFNFFNVSLVFFRAREWKDAGKVLKGMAGLTQFVLPESWSAALGFLSPYGVRFGSWMIDIRGDGTVPILLLLATGGVLALKNSGRLQQEFRPGFRKFLFVVALFTTAFFFKLYLKIGHEFIYFNF